MEEEAKIVFRAVVEVLGKPKEHVDETLKGYITKLKENERYTVLGEEYAQIQKQEDQEMWMNFAEIEVKTQKVEDLVAFCFDYMPSLLEIIEPNELALKAKDISNFLNDLQAKLHGVDMVAKHVKMENDILQKNMAALLKNYITVLLGNRELTAQELSRLTGVTQEKLEDFLDQLIDEGKIDLKGETYYLTKNVKQ